MSAGPIQTDIRYTEAGVIVLRGIWALRDSATTLYSSGNGFNPRERGRAPNLVSHPNNGAFVKFIPALIQPANPSDALVGSSQQHTRGTEGDLWDVGSRVIHTELSPTSTRHSIFIPT